MAHSRPRAAFLFFNPAMFRPTLAIAEAMAALHGYECIVLSPTYLPETERYRSECDELGLAFLCGMTASFADNDVVADALARYPRLDDGEALARAERERAAFSMILPASPRQPPGAFAERFGVRGIEWLGRERGVQVSDGVRAELAALEPQLRYWGRLYEQLVREACAQLAALGPVLVACAEENVDYNSAVFIEAARRMGRAAVCFSSALPTPKEAAAYYVRHPEHQVGSGELDGFFRAALGEWVYRFEGRLIARLPMARAMAMEICGLAPQRPWVINTGASGIVAVESTFMRELFRDLGVDTFPGRVQDLGHPALDALHRAERRVDDVRRGALQGPGMRPERPIALFSLPTNQYASMAAPGFASYDDLLAHWVRSMTRLSSYNCVVTPHPAMPRGDVDRVRALGAHVIDKPAAELLPACDLFVASMSTTIKWARAMGKPVVNYDCYHMKYDPEDRKSYLDGYEHIHLARSEEDYLGLLDRFNRPDEARVLMRGARDGAEYWGRVDGRALERITGAFDAAARNAAP